MVGVGRRLILLLVAIVVAVSALTGIWLVHGGRNTRAHPREVGQAPGPPKGSVVLARESRELAVALAVQPGRPLQVTATVVGQSGSGVDGLAVALTATGKSGQSTTPGRPCGHGCYRATLSVAAPTRFTVRIAGAGAPHVVVFPVAGPWPPADGSRFLGRATRAFRRRRSVLFRESLSGGLGHSVLTTWKLAAPDRIEYRIQGGAAGIVIGTRRWDRSNRGLPWAQSQTTLLPQPSAPWGSRITNAHILARTPRQLTASWVDPVVPAWFTATFDRRTALPIELRMTAASHFMRQRYVAFDRELRIVPPKAK
ncbi:MAG: hypothetical protein QOD08_1939 [Gaiellaceae bacterium]|nr:hypothetical protein [Gaiellaceae bacterium]